MQSVDFGGNCFGPGIRGPELSQVSGLVFGLVGEVLCFYVPKSLCVQRRDEKGKVSFVLLCGVSDIRRTHLTKNMRIVL